MFLLLDFSFFITPLDPTNYFFLSLTHHSFTHHSLYLSLYQSLYISTTLSILFLSLYLPTYVNISTYFNKLTYPTYLCLSYLHLPTNPLLPAYVYLPTSTYLPIYINIPTYVYLPTYTNLCQPTIIYLPPPIPKYQYIIVADLGTSIGLVLFVEVKGNAAKLCSITVMGYVSLAKSNQIFSCLKSLLNN